MVSLLDVAPSVTTVKVGGKDLPVRGLGLSDLAYLIARYPDVKKLFAGSGNLSELSLDSILDLAPTVLIDIIVCGTSSRGVDGAYEAAERLAMDVQTDIINAVVKETFVASGGPGPFVAKLVKLLGLDTGDGSKALDSIMQKQPKS